MKQKFENVIFERLKPISEHFETPKRIDSYKWEGTSLLLNCLREKGILVKKDKNLYQWKRNPDGVTPLPISYRLVNTLVTSIRLKQESYKERKKMKVIIKNKPLTLWQKLVAWWKS